MLDLVRMTNQSARRKLAVSLGSGLWFFSVQVVVLIALAVEQYNLKSTYKGFDRDEMLWFVYKEVPSALPTATAISVAAVVFALALSTFITTGPKLTASEIPSWLLKHPF